jgi:hypothetical protein
MITKNIDNQWSDIVNHYRKEYPEIFLCSGREEWKFIWEDLEKRFGAKTDSDGGVGMFTDFPDESCYTMFRLRWP